MRESLVIPSILLIFHLVIPAGNCQYIYDLESDASLDGHVTSSGAVQISETISTGDSSSNHEIRGFISFDLASNLPPDSRVVSATLKVFQVMTIGDGEFYGDPYPPLGEISVDHLEYGEILDASDFDTVALSTDIGLVSADNLLGWKTIDVTEAVIADLETSRLRSQFRIHFTNFSDEDFLEDTAHFESRDNSYNTGNIPVLTISLMRLISLQSSIGLDGIARSDGYFSTTLGLAAGDTSVNLYQRGFLTYDLSSIPTHISLSSVKLKIYQNRTLGNGSLYGNPYSSLGVLYLEVVDYGDSLDASDFDASPITEDLIYLGDNDTDKEWKEADVTAVIRNAYHSGAISIQFRLRFELDTDNDNAGDIAYFESSDNYWQTGKLPELLINYQPFVAVPTMQKGLSILLLIIVSFLICWKPKRNRI